MTRYDHHGNLKTEGRWRRHGVCRIWRQHHGGGLVGENNLWVRGACRVGVHFRIPSACGRWEGGIGETTGAGAKRKVSRSLTMVARVHARNASACLRSLSRGGLCQERRRGAGGSRQSSNALLTTGCAPRGERKYSTVVDCRRWLFRMPRDRRGGTMVSRGEKIK